MDIKAKVGGRIYDLESFEDLVARVEAGEIESHHPVLYPPMRRWAHAGEIPELVAALEVAAARGGKVRPGFFARLRRRLLGR